MAGAVDNERYKVFKLGKTKCFLKVHFSAIGC
jgi:hypothetical protein